LHVIILILIIIEILRGFLKSSIRKIHLITQASLTFVFIAGVFCSPVFVSAEAILAELLLAVSGGVQVASSALTTSAVLHEGRVQTAIPVVLFLLLCFQIIFQLLKQLYS
jgi:hypothetical protein